MFALNKKKYNIRQIFRYTQKHLKHLRNDVRPEIYIYIVKIRTVEQTEEARVTRNC